MGKVGYSMEKQWRPGNTLGLQIPLFLSSFMTREVQMFCSQVGQTPVLPNTHSAYSQAYHVIQYRGQPLTARSLAAFSLCGSYPCTVRLLATWRIVPALQCCLAAGKSSGDGLSPTAHLYLTLPCIHMILCSTSELYACGDCRIVVFWVFLKLLRLKIQFVCDQFA